MSQYDYADYADYYENGTDNDTYYLETDDEDCPGSHLPGSHIYLPVLYLLMFLAGFLGNLFVISVVGAKPKRCSRLVDTFVVNLALADLVFVLTLPLWAASAAQGGRWDFGSYGDDLCKLSSYVIAVNRFSNVFFLTCMSVDRYLAVVRLMDFRLLRKSLRVRLTCAVVWALSLALGAPSLLYRGVRMTAGGPSCLDDEQSPLFLGLSVSTVFLTFALPVTIILLCYGTVLARLYRQRAASTGNPRAEVRHRHSLKMVLTIVGAFLVSWLPFNVFKIVLLGARLSEADVGCTPAWLRGGLVLSCCLAFLNSCVNPPLYFFLDHHFRRQAENLCRSCVGRPEWLQSYGSSLTNRTLESFGTSAARSRPQSTDRKD